MWHERQVDQEKLCQTQKKRALNSILCVLITTLDNNRQTIKSCYCFYCQLMLEKRTRRCSHQFVQLVIRSAVKSLSTSWAGLSCSVSCALQLFSSQTFLSPWHCTVTNPRMHFLIKQVASRKSKLELWRAWGDLYELTGCCFSEVKVWRLFVKHSLFRDHRLLVVAFMLVSEVYLRSHARSTI